MTEIETPKGNGKVIKFDTKDDLMVGVAKHAAHLAKTFCQERGSFTLVISGGSVPECLGKLLEKPYIDEVDWSKWNVFWVDERVVSKTSEDSNYLLAYNYFLSKVPIPACNVHAINEELAANGDAEGAAAWQEAYLKELVKAKRVDVSDISGFPKFDLMLLGMGPDGHVASLFPGNPLLEEKIKWVASVDDSPTPPHIPRITCTLPVINASANVVLVVPDQAKASAVYTALADVNEPTLLPVERVKPEGPLMWFLDQYSASLLPLTLTI